MTKVLVFVMFSAFALMAIDATATPIPLDHGPVTINWTVFQQKLDDAPQYAGFGKTNILGSGKGRSTNVLQNYKFTYTSSTINNAGFLDLLANSLNTNFPAGTRLETDGDGVFVVDSSGTNVIADISPIVTSTVTNKVTFGLDTTVLTTTGSKTNGTESSTRSGNEIVIVNYDDSGVTTKDGTTTTFTFVGESAFTDSGSATTSDGVEKVKRSGSFTLKGAGYGTIHNVPSNIQGTVVGLPAENATITED